MTDRTAAPFIAIDNGARPRNVDPKGAPAAITPIMAYWNTLRHGNAVPARAAIDPGAIAPYLSSSGMVERSASGAVRLRLAGQDLQRLMRMNPRGLPLRTLFTLTSRARLAELVAQVFDGPGLLSMTMTADQGSAPPITAQMAMMPLRDTNGRITRAMIVLNVPKVRTISPCRFHIRQAHVAPVTPVAEHRPLARRGPRLAVIDGGRP
jgi:hypothetical protein